ncbi:NAD(P)-dependent oxidoreductase [Hirschia baltica]|uniref:6-phosphogluconate dehydrogenase NAD-binding n=1 Tax=Hirschia baltica (strain ATCC 49814 / DSM 5838 / IFAM 1418) TaxID=582402 RepID=C6XIV3_HIRBI|nr:NAD(P)-dependent oxidoreductase [Hirschia baltica]ACT59048.1 6-phosphogluconate dehydrogenase NAD-binding [Hirschia baltica ATCC 49814]
MTKCAFLGLGVMGGPMAGWLATKGHSVTVWNRSITKADAWALKYKGLACATPLDAIQDAEFVMMCLGDDPDVDAVFEQIETGIKPGMIVIDHTTTSADLAKRISDKCSAKGAHFIDGPVSGGEAGAVNGKLTVMAGADQAVFEKVVPVMQAYAATITRIGEVGTGQLAKSVNQICIAGVLQGLAEGLHFAMKHDLDTDQVLKAVSGGSAQSWQMENRGKTMVAGEYEFGFAVDWLRKDLRIALDAARKSGASLPVTAVIDQFYSDVQKKGGGRWDSSSLLTRLNTDSDIIKDK